MEPAPGAFQSGNPPAPSAPLAADPSLLLTWPKTAQLALGLLLTAGLFFLLGRWSLDWTRPQPLPEGALVRHGPALDLNKATKAELRLLPGVGDALAQRIIDYRVQHGPFASLDELRHISGFGPKTLDRLRPWLFVTPPEKGVAVHAVSKYGPAPKAAAASKMKATLLTAAIDVNHASQAELQKLPGIGPKLSQRILDERAKAPFKSVEDLRRVPGIGPKTLERLRPHVTIDAAKLHVAE